MDGQEQGSAGSLTFEEIAVACRNVGINLDCGGCASAFFTGFGGDPHDENCTRQAKPRLGCALLLLLPLCLVLTGCLSGLATQKAKAFSDNPTPTDSAVYCCAVKAIFGDETCDAHPVVPQPLWDRAAKKCSEGQMVDGKGRQI